MGRGAATLAGALALCLAAGAAAPGTLIDRVVTFATLTYDDPEKPLYVGRGRTVIVSDDVEFGLTREGVQNGLDVVPVGVNIGAARVEVDFSGTEPNTFATARFNGYVLRFEAECVLFEGAEIDREATTLPLTEEAVGFDGGTLTINVSGLRFDRASRIAVNLDVADCPLS